MTIGEQVERFLAAPAFGVAGASANRDKFGNKVLRCYLQNNRRVIPVNPGEAMIEGVAAVASISDLPADVKSVSFITPPAVTEKLVPLAIERGVENIWMQPGAQSSAAVSLCKEKGVNVIADGSCILVVLGYRDH